MTVEYSFEGMYYHLLIIPAMKDTWAVSSIYY